GEATYTVVIMLEPLQIALGCDMAGECDRAIRCDHVIDSGALIPRGRGGHLRPQLLDRGWAGPEITCGPDGKHGQQDRRNSESKARLQAARSRHSRHFPVVEQCPHRGRAILRIRLQHWRDYWAKR